MKDSNLKILAAYRMYQAPEGGGEKPVRTSYLKDLDVSTGRGGGVGVPPRAHHQSQGQKMSGQIMSGQNVSSLRLFNIAFGKAPSDGREPTLERAGSCPVVNLLHSTRQEPSDGRRVAKPTSRAPTEFLGGEQGTLNRARQSNGHTVAVVDTVTDRPSSGVVRTRDSVT